MANKAQITREMAARAIIVTREFAAWPENVWRAWTEAALLDKWWAPKPWEAQTKTFDFKVGGSWLYAMTGPAGEKHWSRFDYTAIVPGQSFTMDTMFCDENGTPNAGFGVGHWLVEFIDTGSGTKVVTTNSFDNDADMERMITMGFEGGFSMGLDNLEELLKTGV